MYPHCLKLKLQEKNIDCEKAQDQLFWRAASQVNTYLRMVNSRVGSIEETEASHSRFLDLVATIARVKTMEKADTITNWNPNSGLPCGFDLQ